MNTMNPDHGCALFKISWRDLCSMQRPDGTISVPGLLLFWPYHWGLRTKLFIQRRITSEPAWNRITPDW